MIHNITVYAYTCMACMYVCVHACMCVCVCVCACVRACACNEFICRNLCSCISAVVPNSMVVLHGCLHLGGYLVILVNRSVGSNFRLVRQILFHLTST